MSGNIQTLGSLLLYFEMLPRNYIGIDIPLHSLLKLGITAFHSVQEISSVCDFPVIAVNERSNPVSFTLNLTKQ